MCHFYPRSPCGERPIIDPEIKIATEFLSTLSLRRATCWARSRRQPSSNFYPRSPCGERPGVSAYRQTVSYFYPRSPCGERLEQSSSYNAYLEISIHALLAESDLWGLTGGSNCDDFYPRSPCGERLHYDNYNLHCVEISIHALLAESDYVVTRGNDYVNIFLSTLSLRRATS